SRHSAISTNTSCHPSFDNVSRPTTSEEQAPLGSSQSGTRPLSTSTSTTIRGFPSSSPTISKDGNLTAEHYTALTKMILTEQAARQHLERLVQSLQRQLQALHSSTLASYPTPSPDQMAAPLHEGDIAGGELSSFEQGDSSDDGRYINENPQTPREERAHSGTEIFGGV